MKFLSSLLLAVVLTAQSLHAQPAVQLTTSQRAEVAKQVRTALGSPAKVDPGLSPSKGPVNAPLTLIEFSDFQCPACNAARASFITPLLNRYPGKVRVVYKHFPLTRVHEHAFEASKAAWAATQQGKFFEYHDQLFDRQKELGEKTFIDIARKLKLDEARFNRDRKSKAAEAQIRRDMAQGEAINLQGTPTFVLNGLVLGSGTPLAVVDIIVEVLKKDKGLKV